MTEPCAPALSIELRFGDRPQLSSFGSTRRFIQEIFDPLVGPDASSRMAMVVHELMENLAKYSSGGPVSLGVEFLPDAGEGIARISATNRITAGQLEELKRILDDLAETRDPRARYLDYMKVSVGRKEGSGLGLIRIRAEGEMSIQYSTTGSEVTVVAETRLPVRSKQ